jgi:hypothetical protein
VRLVKSNASEMVTKRGGKSWRAPPIKTLVRCRAPALCTGRHGPTGEEDAAPTGGSSASAQCFDGRCSRRDLSDLCTATRATGEFHSTGFHCVSSGFCRFKSNKLCDILLSHRIRRSLFSSLSRLFDFETPTSGRNAIESTSTRQKQKVSRWER